MCKNLINVNFFLPKLGATRFPFDLRTMYIRVVIRQDFLFDLPFGRAHLVNRRPSWVRIGVRGVPKEVVYYNAYIEMPTGHHYETDYKQKLKSANEILSEAFIHFSENRKFIATGFMKYAQVDLDRGQHGRFYITYPQGHVYTALLQPVVEETHVGEPYSLERQPSSPKMQPGCCSFLPLRGK